MPVQGYLNLLGEYFVIAGAAADGVGIQLDDGVDHVGVCAEGTGDEGVGAQAI